MTNCTTAMSTEPPPFVFKSILPHVVLAIVLVVLLVSHFVHHHINYTQRKHHRPSAAAEDTDGEDDAEAKATNKGKMVMVVSPMKARADVPVVSGREVVDEHDKYPYSSRIEVMEYTSPLQGSPREDRSDDDVSVDDIHDVPPRRRLSGPDQAVSVQSVRSGGQLRPASGSVSQSALSLRMGSSGLVNPGQVSDGQEALGDAELITPVGSTNALLLFDQIPEPTSKLRNMEEVKLRLKPAPIIQINERHTVL